MAQSEQRLVRKVAWRLMPLIMISYFFAFFDRINIGFAKAELTADLGLSNTAYGLGASLFVVGYVLCEVPSNLFLYKVGARQWIARIMVSWGLATAAMVLVTSPWQFYALRFVTGAMEAGFAPGIIYYLSTWFPTSHRGRITSALFVASACSGMFGGPLAGAILAWSDGLYGLAGWHWLFLFGGLPCVVLGLVVLRFLDNQIDDARWLDANEKVQLATMIVQTEQDGKSHSLLDAIRSPAVLLLGLLYFLIQIGSYGLNFWAPDLIRSAGVTSALATGMLTAVPYVCGVGSMIVIGYLSDQSGERRVYVVGCLIAAAAGFIGAGLFDRSIGGLVLALGLIGAGIIAAIPAFWALPPKLLTGAGAAGGIALINTLGQCGGIVSPLLVGRIKDVSGSATPALYVIGGLCVLGAAILMFAAPAALRARDQVARSTGY
ncbi:MFS transporter [Allosphingosinicella deserti]|uniref:MFS transporter n=1 Tax=Allosphingosinicella deserti TaxID=2116704 RepID=UPI0018EBC75D|nr:MFS transporter [Sphingomonas deserti]